MLVSRFVSWHFNKRFEYTSNCNRKICSSFDEQTAQEENRIGVQLFGQVNDEETFLQKIVTGNENLVYDYDIETKVQSSQLVGKGSPHPKNHLSQCLGGAHFFSILIELYSSNFFLKVKQWIVSNIRAFLKKRSELRSDNSWFIHHAQSVFSFVPKIRWLSFPSRLTPQTALF